MQGLLVATEDLGPLHVIAHPLDRHPHEHADQEQVHAPIASRIEVVTVHLLPCLAAAIAMYREMGMSFWPERALAEMADPAPSAA